MVKMATSSQTSSDWTTWYNQWFDTFNLLFGIWTLSWKSIHGLKWLLWSMPGFSIDNHAKENDFKALIVSWHQMAHLISPAQHKLFHSKMPPCVATGAFVSAKGQLAGLLLKKEIGFMVSIISWRQMAHLKHHAKQKKKLPNQRQNQLGLFQSLLFQSLLSEVLDTIYHLMHKLPCFGYEQCPKSPWTNSTNRTWVFHQA